MIGMRRILKNLEDNEIVITHYTWLKAYELTVEGFGRMLDHYIDLEGEL